ncbi:Protein of unknown function [Pyronema omphalodes CBS 100304]|uniref:Uncharacterized protein n=1 Tax=Pyronema omphalodes (strain CBS 100304) TaxID=1076935 RepID=U4LKU0_PYROM|nr:Protein of unknown function [Pyronema omphalodes CBS 100304]
MLLTTAIARWIGMVITLLGRNAILLEEILRWLMYVG